MSWTLWVLCIIGFTISVAGSLARKRYPVSFNNWVVWSWMGPRATEVWRSDDYFRWVTASFFFAVACYFVAFCLAIYLLSLDEWAMGFSLIFLTAILAYLGRQKKRPWLMDTALARHQKGEEASSL